MRWSRSAGYVMSARLLCGVVRSVPWQAAAKVSQRSLSMLDSQLDDKACMWNGRLRIPCGNGFVTLPAMSGIG
jgi:hypothetical protein